MNFKTQGSLGALLGVVMSVTVAVAGDFRSWITTEDLRLATSPQPVRHCTTGVPASGDRATRRIDIDPANRLQTILGMGASLEHTTCSNLFRLSPAARGQAITRLVDSDRGIGMNLMRLCIGTSDFAGEPWYSYDDLPAGTIDPTLSKFSIEKDRATILPMARLALRTNPSLLFFASPWSPPGWMKTSGSMIGGELKREWYPVYAQYLVRFLQAYRAEGIPIYALTVQNEPGVDRARSKDPKWHYPSCHWTAEQERDFIRDHLGPALKQAGLNTRIWCYDHNYNLEPSEESDGLPHPRTILEDPVAAGFVDGVAFHHYAGEPDGMSRFHAEFPGKPIRFTEGSVFSIWGGYDLVQRFRNWATTYNAWVVMLDEQGLPNNGPFPATRAILKLHSDTGRVEELFEYHNYGHFMKRVRRGAVRIGSSGSDRDLSNVCFVNPDGSVVLVLVNTTDTARQAVVVWKSKSVTITSPAKSVTTCMW
jgi:O-glycosyl hydrolase